MDFSTIALIGITFLAAFVNGALGYGFSSITVPVALLFLSNKLLNPALVLIEVSVNIYSLFINRASVPEMWKRVYPILFGLLPGVLCGSYLVASINPGWMKFVTYLVLLPLILIQAAGLRKPIRSERLIGVLFGAGLGLLYSVTTISGPPIALFLLNQGLVKRDFRASLAIVRVAESTLTALAYYHLGLFTQQSVHLVGFILPGLIIGIPLGAYFIRHVDGTMFGRICRTFDVWLVGFGLSRVLVELKLAQGISAYGPLMVAALIDACLLYTFLRQTSPTRLPKPVLSPTGD